MKSHTWDDLKNEYEQRINRRINRRQRTKKKKKKKKKNPILQVILLGMIFTRDYALLRQYSGWKAAKCLKTYTFLARIRSELSTARRFLVGCANTEGVEKSRTRAEVGVDKWRQRDLMRAAGAFIFMRTNRRTWSRLSATESDQLGSFLSATVALLAMARNQPYLFL